ncbi:MAG: tetratricopeptide repeat protein [Ferruginibacter sp.]|nr:tetratricopeptide repeat protein [Ferruginibacter sp.]
MKNIIKIAVILACVACNNSESSSPSPSVTVNNKEQDLKNNIAKFPDSILLKETLIQYYEDNGNADLAVAETKNLLQKDSLNVKYWDKLAQLYIYSKNDTASAISCLEKAINIYPEPAYIISLGVMYAQTKNAKALEVAEALLIGKKANADKEALFIKGLYYGSINDKQKAITFFDECIKQDYTYVSAYLEKGIILYNDKKYQQSLDVFTKAVTVQNAFDEGYFWMGKCFEKLNNTKDAIESYKMALAYDPNYIEAKDALGKLGISN